MPTEGFIFSCGIKHFMTSPVENIDTDQVSSVPVLLSFVHPQGLY